MTTTSKPVEYVIEFYKPREIRGHGGDPYRTWKARSPFQAVHVGDQLDGWVFLLDGQDPKTVQEDFGGKDIAEAVAVVTHVRHQLHETNDYIRHILVVFTKHIEPES